MIKETCEGLLSKKTPHCRTRWVATGAWLKKAKTCDLVTVCLGVNDLYREAPSAKEMKQNFTKLLHLLKNSGCRVVLQTIPPFVHTPEILAKANEVNAYLKDVLSKEADGFFDVVPLLDDPEHPGFCKYGGHPDERGCAVWGTELAKVLKPSLR